MNTLDNNPNEFAEMLEGMTKQELVKYGKITFGLPFTGKYERTDMINQIKQSARKFQLNDNIRVGEELAKEDLMPGFAEIQLHRTDMLKKSRSVIVGLQGKFASLPIGPKFWCPVELLNILKDAVRIEYDQDTTVEPPELVAKEVHAYPFTVFRMNPHTKESLSKMAKTRGLKGRAPLAAVKIRAAKLGVDLN